MKFGRSQFAWLVVTGRGIVVLEDYDAARARGARIYAEIVGFGMSADAQDLVAPAPEGAARAIKAALLDGRLNAADVTYVNAHGTGTQANDAAETRALHLAFKDHAHRLAISSTKSMLGHALGASGGIELVATLWRCIIRSPRPPRTTRSRIPPATSTTCRTRRAGSTWRWR